MHSLKLLLFIPFFAILFLFTQCKTSQLPADVPSCIKKMIRQIEKDSIRNPAASVWQYQYNGNTVYYIPPYCCDLMGQLFDSNCNLICNPDGGITGAGDGKCRDFISKRSNERLIWKDSRK